MDTNTAKLLTARLNRLVASEGSSSAVRIEDDRIAFRKIVTIGGGPWEEGHSLDIGTSTPERVEAHFRGFFEGLILEVAS